MDTEKVIFHHKCGKGNYSRQNKMVKFKSVFCKAKYVIETCFHSDHTAQLSD